MTLCETTTCRAAEAVATVTGYYSGSLYKRLLNLLYFRYFEPTCIQDNKIKTNNKTTRRKIFIIYI
jgi:hypothetical protein